MTAYCKTEDLPRIAGYGWSFGIDAAGEGCYTLIPRFEHTPTAAERAAAIQCALAEHLRTHADARGWLETLGSSNPRAWIWGVNEDGTLITWDDMVAQRATPEATGAGEILSRCCNAPTKYLTAQGERSIRQCQCGQLDGY